MSEEPKTQWRYGVSSYYPDSSVAIDNWFFDSARQLAVFAMSQLTAEQQQQVLSEANRPLYLEPVEESKEAV